MVRQIIKNILLSVTVILWANVGYGATECEIVTLSLIGELGHKDIRVNVPSSALTRVFSTRYGKGKVLAYNEVSTPDALPVFVSFTRHAKGRWGAEIVSNDRSKLSVPRYYNKRSTHGYTILSFDESGDLILPQTLFISALEETSGVTLILDLSGLQESVLSAVLNYEIRYDGTAECLESHVDSGHNVNGGITNQLTIGLKDVLEGFLFKPNLQ